MSSKEKKRDNAKKGVGLGIIGRESVRREGEPRHGGIGGCEGNWQPKTGEQDRVSMTDAGENWGSS